MLLTDRSFHIIVSICFALLYWMDTTSFEYKLLSSSYLICTELRNRLWFTIG